MAVTHLTFTCNDAGKPICNQVKQSGDSGLHWVYVDRILAKPEHYPNPLCEECKRFVDDESNFA